MEIFLQGILPISLFITAFIFVFLGVPVAFALGGTAVIFGLFTFGFDFFNLLPSRFYGSMSNFLLVAIPLFVFMGTMLEKSGIAEKMLDTLAVVLSKINGGLAMSVVLVGAILGASTGIVGATVTTLTLLSLPVMLKRGYSQSLATGTICASGTLGQIIPPSIVMVLLSSVMSISVGDIYFAAIIPSLIIVTLYLIYIFIFSSLKPSHAPKLTKEEIIKFKGENFSAKVFRSLVLPFFLIFAVLGSIFFGVASPTEASGIGAFASILLAGIEKQLNWKNLKTAAKDTTLVSCMVFTILFGANIFGLVFRGINGDVFFVDVVEQSHLSKYTFVWLVMVIVFFLGFFIDFIEIIFIVIPITMPIFNALDVDPLWIAILLSINLQTSFLTPPFGFSLFYLTGVAPKEIKTVNVYKGVIVFIAIQVFCFIIIYFYKDFIYYFIK